jgi:uncharacterized protein DUF6922
LFQEESGVELSAKFLLGPFHQILKSGMALLENEIQIDIVLESSRRPIEQALFWSYRFEDFNPQKDKKLVLIQLINYGTLTHWRWLVAMYGKVGVRGTLESIPATEINPRTRILATILFLVADWYHAPPGCV